MLTEAQAQSFTDRPEKGASAVEYGLLVAAIAAVIAVIVFTLGSPTLGMYKNTCDAWSSEASASTC